MLYLNLYFNSMLCLYRSSVALECLNLCISKSGHSIFLNSMFQLRVHVDPLTNCTIPYTPSGRFIHVPPPCPSSDWANNFGRPWWRDDTYCIGILSGKTRFVKIINTLTSQNHVLEVKTCQ